MTSRAKRWSLATLVVASLAAAGAWGFAHFSFKAARRELERFHPRAAQTRLDRCRWLYSGRSEYHLLAARSARLLGEFDRAETHLAECQRREGTASEDSTIEWALLQAQQGELEPVEEFLRQHVDRKHPLSSVILDGMTVGYLRVYRVFDAMNCVRLWLEREPNHPRALALRGQTHQRVHAFGRAVDDFQAVLDQEPGDDDLRLRLANALVENSQAPDAVPHLELLRQRRPEDPDVLVRLAFAWNIAGRTKESGALLDDLLVKHPTLGPALSARGQLELQLQRPAEAERWLRKALQATPFDRQSHYALFQALQQQGKETEADAQEQRLKKIETTINRMIEVSNRQLPLRPRDPKLNHELGQLLEEMGYDEIAAGWYRKAIQYDPTFEPAQKSLAEYYRKRR